MIKLFDRYIALEMFGLWIVEFILLATVLFLLLVYGTTPFDSPAIANAAAAHLRVFGQAVLCALTISLLSVATGLYRADICLRRGKFMVTTFTATLLLAPALLGLGNIIGLSLSPTSHLTLLKILGGWITCMAVTRAGFFLAQRADWLARRVLVVGSSQSAVRIQNIIDARGSSFCRVVGNVVLSPVAQAHSAFDMAELKGRKIWSVVLATETASRDAARAAPVAREHVLRGIRDLAHFRNSSVFDEAGFCETWLQRLDIENLPPGWNEVVREASIWRWSDAAQRAIDIVASCTLLFLTAPLMLLIALAIKLDTHGPVFYSQERVGRHGKVFKLRKFRSMVVNAESVGKPVWAAHKDSRITAIGRLIRATRMDELPQLLNVLFGEMGFIGPRPERPHFVDRLAECIPHYNDRACVKPGITGWAQVRFPYGASIEDARMKLAYDLYYIKHRSLLLNAMIMVATIRVILFQEGAR
jgi:exopolysaccharide biosynthesis polyprenyl glycosylphosphotransferase